MGLLSNENLTQYQISKRLGKKYNTILDRLKSLQTQGIIKEIGRVKATKSGAEITVYGLAPRGLTIAVFNSPNKNTQSNALNRCSILFGKAWTFFCELYNIRGKESESFLRWIKSDEGVRGVLGYYGPWIVENEAQTLLGIRRMIDLAISLEQSSIISDLITYAYHSNVSAVNLEPTTLEEKPLDVETLKDALKILAKIASRHPVLVKLSKAVKEADAPLLTKIEGDLKKNRERFGTWTISIHAANAPLSPINITTRAR